MSAKQFLLVPVLLATACLVVAGGVSQGATVTLQNGLDSYAGMDHARIRDNSSQNDVQTGGAGIIGDSSNDADNRMLYRFDLSAYAGMTVTGDGLFSAVISGTSATPDISDFFDAYLVDVNNLGWETTGPSWREYNESGNVAWKDSGGADLANSGGATGAAAPGTGDGGLGAPGDGYASVAFGSFNETAYAVNDVVSLTVPQAVLQGWIDGTNAGFIVRKRDELDFGRIVFKSITDGTISNRPSLEFDVVPEPTAFLLMTFGVAGLGLVRRRRRSMS